MDATPAIDVQQHCVVSQRTEALAPSVLETMRQRLPRTRLVAAKPAPMCGMVALELENGNTIFTDKAGRYFIVGLMFDSASGKTLDGRKQLNRD